MDAILWAALVVLVVAVIGIVYTDLIPPDEPYDNGWEDQ